MSPRDLSVGHAYYQVTYADNELTIPGVDPMIYVGLNIFPDDDAASKTYYFQDPVSHSWKGPVTDSTHNTKHPEIETLVFPHSEHQVLSEVFTLAEVVAAVTEAHRRSEDKGK